MFSTFFFPPDMVVCIVGRSDLGAVIQDELDEVRLATRAENSYCSQTVLKSRKVVGTQVVRCRNTYTRAGNYYDGRFHHHK